MTTYLVCISQLTCSFGTPSKYLADSVQDDIILFPATTLRSIINIPIGKLNISNEMSFQYTEVENIK